MASDSEATRSVHILISGRVQGVWFRGWTRETAWELGLDGWVRNRRDGNVEAVFAGPSAAVAKMLQRCELGPPGARVSAIDIIGERGAVQAGFEIRPTL